MAELKCGKSGLLLVRIILRMVITWMLVSCAASATNMYIVSQCTVRLVFARFRRDVITSATDVTVSATRASPMSARSETFQTSHLFRFVFPASCFLLPRCASW